MKNINVISVTNRNLIKNLLRSILGLFTEELMRKKSGTLVEIVAISFLPRETWQDTRNPYIEE